MYPSLGYIVHLKSTEQDNVTITFAKINVHGGDPNMLKKSNEVRPTAAESSDLTNKLGYGVFS